MNVLLNLRGTHAAVIFVKHPSPKVQSTTEFSLQV